MIKITLICLAVFTAVLLLFLSCNSGEKLRKLEKPAIIRMYEKYSKKKIESPDDFCVEEAQGLDGVYCLGWFDHDLGCMGDEILVGNSIGHWKDLMPKALNLLGWKEENKRSDLALKWVKSVIIAWKVALKEKPENFGDSDFEKPNVKKKPEGYFVKLWVQEPSGMMPENNYYQLEIMIGSNAELIKVDLTKRLNVPIKRGQ